MYTFIELPIFSRLVADYFTDAELAELQVALANNPTLGDVVQGTQGVRKGCAKCVGHAKAWANAAGCACCIMCKIYRAGYGC